MDRVALAGRTVEIYRRLVASRLVKYFYKAGLASALRDLGQQSLLAGQHAEAMTAVQIG